MTTWTITGTSSATWPGGALVGTIDFETAGAFTAHIDADEIVAASQGGPLHLTVLASAGADTLVIHGTGEGSVDASAVAFGEGWSSAVDTLVLRDTTGDGTMFGSARSDRIVVTGGHDGVYGGAGTDTLLIDYSSYGSDFSGSLSSGLGISDLDDAGNGPGVNSVFASWDVERIDITLGSGDDSIEGGYGDDTIRGGAGDDSLQGNDGRDLVYGEGGDDTLRGGINTDKGNTLYGGKGDDRLSGAIYGDGGADALYGGAGNDHLEGYEGADILSGGSGNDGYSLDDSGAVDTIVEAKDGGTDRVYAYADFDLSGTNVENLSVDGYDITATGSGGDNLILSGLGDHRLEGRGGRDDIQLGVDDFSDTVVVDDASDSTGTTRDRVRDLGADGEDVFDFGKRVDEVIVVKSGSLSAATFDRDLAAIVDPILMSGDDRQAVVVDPSGGDLDKGGLRQLVVDANRDGHYTAGVDYVVELVDQTGALDISDFI